MPSKNKLESLSVAQLKEKLEKIWGKHEKLCRTQMAPLLYHLRLKLKAQGKSGAGFGAWVEDKLDISRRTADRWADEWAISRGLKKPSKRVKRGFTMKPTSGQMSKSADGRLVVNFQMNLTEADNKAWLAALRILGPSAQKVVFDAVVNAAHAPKKPAVSAGEADRKRLTFLDEQPDRLASETEHTAMAKGAGK
jgi:hypothetical protein